MQIPFKPVRQTKSAFALMTVLAFMAASLLVFASIMYLVCGNSKITSQNNLYNISQAAAEGATERVVAQLDRDFLYQNLQNAGVYQVLLPTNDWPVQLQFSDTNGTANQITVNIAPLDYSTNYFWRVKALEVNGVTPDKKTIASGKYPLSRPLYLVTNGYPTLNTPTHAFCTFFLSEKGQEIITAKGFVALTSY